MTNVVKNELCDFIPHQPYPPIFRRGFNPFRRQPPLDVARRPKRSPQGQHTQTCRSSQLSSKVTQVSLFIARWTTRVYPLLGFTNSLRTARLWRPRVQGISHETQWLSLGPSDGLAAILVGKLFHLSSQLPYAPKNGHRGWSAITRMGGLSGAQEPHPILRSPVRL